MMQRFVIMERPVGKGRPRFSPSGHAYTPEKTREYEHRVQYIARKAGISIYNGPLMVTMEFCMGIPQNWPEARKQAAKRGQIEPTTKPDIDNLIKAIMDAMNGIAWNDDKQVVGIIATKHYAESSKTIVSISTMEENKNA